MFDHLEISDEIESRANYVRSAIGENGMRLIHAARADLMHGPRALQYGDFIAVEAVDVDSPYRVVSFGALVDSIRDRLESVDAFDDIKTEIEYCEETEESTYEAIDGTGDSVVAAILGSELSSHV